MRPPTPQPRWGSLDGMSPGDVQSVLAGARALGAMSGIGPAPRHWHVAVLCEATSSASADAVVAAASALGATVVRLRPSTLHLGDGQAVRDTAHLLGRLYDLIECDGLGAPLTAALSRCAGVPVLGEVAQAAHPVRILADLLTMQEHAGRPPQGITLGLNRGARRATAAAWARMAELTGLRLVPVGPVVPVGPPAMPGGCDFVHAPGPRRRGGRAPDLMAMRGGAGGPASLLAQQADSHRRVVQVVLTNVMS